MEWGAERSDEFRRLQKKGAVTCTVNCYSAVFVWTWGGRKLQLLRRYPVCGTGMESGTDPLHFVWLINI
jgi:hypothetical protein